MRCATPVIATVAVLAVSCTTYPKRVERALADFEAGRFGAAYEFLANEVDSPFLSGAEAGMVALAAGEWAHAREALERAAEAAADVEERALLGAERLGETIATWAVNDTLRAYQGEGFERVYVHTALALTYLAEGLLDGVYVEARRGNQLLEAEEKLYETSYRAGGFGHLLSALVYELLGEPDDAYIDYKRMAEKDVGSALVGPALVRLAERLGRTDELEQWRERFGPAPELPAGAASVVLLAGVGLGPYKVEGSLAVPLREGVFKLAVPEYVARRQAVTELRLVDQESGVGARTEVIENVGDVARRNLADRIAWVTAKSALRGAAKVALTDKLETEYGAAGWLAGVAYSLFSERADLRAWMTLPNTWQAARLHVPPGERTLILDLPGGEIVHLGRFRLDPGETMFVLARTLGTRAWAHVVGGVPVEPPDELGSP